MEERVERKGKKEEKIRKRSTKIKRLSFLSVIAHYAIF